MATKDQICQKLLADAFDSNTLSKDKTTLVKIFSCQMSETNVRNRTTLKKKILEYLSATPGEIGLFRLSEIPSKPGVWDEDIIQKLFESKMVSVKYEDAMGLFSKWTYHRHDPVFYKKIINRYAPEQKKSMETLLNLSQKYKALYTQKSLPLTGDWQVEIFDNDGINTTSNTVSLKIPSVAISRNRYINTYLGIKYYPDVSLQIHPPFKSNFRSKKNEMKIALDSALESCAYRSSILLGISIAVAKKNGIVVGGFSFEKRGKSLHITYLCSSKRVRGIGSVLMYAAEEYAKYVGLKRVYMLAARNAKPFYFKVGYNYLSDTSSHSLLYSTTGSNNNSNNSSSSSSATSKRTLKFPTGTNAKMRKYV